MLPKKNVPNMNQGCMFLCLVSIALQINGVILENNETKTEEDELNPAAANRFVFLPFHPKRVKTYIFYAQLALSTDIVNPH